MTEREQNLLQILNEINDLGALRSQDKKIAFYKLLEKIILDKEMFNEFSIKMSEVINNIKTFKFIGQELLNNKIFSFTKFKDSNLTETKYSGHFITISDEDYVSGGYSLHASDFSTNFDSLGSGVFDYLNNEYIINRENMVEILRGLDVIKGFEYKKNIARASFSINPVFSSTGINVPTLTLLYQQFSDQSKQDQFIQLYTKFLNQEKIFDKIFKVYKLIMKDFTMSFLEKNNIKVDYKGFKEEMGGQFELASELKDKLQQQEKFSFSGKNNSNEGQKIKFIFDINGKNLNFSGVYTETFKKEIIFHDLRKTETRNGIAKTISEIKDKFEKLNFYENKKYKKSNTFISEIKKSNFESTEAFNNFINQDKYKGILTYKNRETLK